MNMKNKNNKNENNNNKKIIKTINPATEEIIQKYEIISKQEIKEKVKNAKEVFEEWKKDIDTRSSYLVSLAEEFSKRKEELARICTNEMGKTIKESLSEVEKCSWVLKYYADNGKILSKDEVINSDARKSTISFEPLGIIASIMPWNFPYWQALRFASPSLMVGNTSILKPSSKTIQCGIKIQEMFENVGIPEGVFQTIVADSTMAEKLIDLEDVRAVTFTGSVPAGAKVAQKAASHIKKCVLELGGSDPFIVLRDADIEKSTTGAVKGRFINCGQSCIASKRFFVVKDIADEFIEKFVQKTEKLRVGDPLSEETDIGPLASSDGLENINEIVIDAIDKGAELLIGGDGGEKGEKIINNNKGYFYKPTILKNISPYMRIDQEETFGPVAPITVVEDEEEAIKYANDSKFGLGASIWTTDLDKAERLPKLIESGIVTVNNVVASDPRVPFGGVKKSGFGRELSRYGMLEFTNIKSVRLYEELVSIHHVE
jgi:succinate-semialdehyde dehydrogenase/glutarate-semialdehyde dehydrogenase/succinyl-CoA reductase